MKHVLEVSDEAALRITRRRLTSQHDAAEVTKHLLELDDGLSMMDRREVEEVVKEQKKIRGKETMPCFAWQAFRAPPCTRHSGLHDRASGALSTNFSLEPLSA